MVLISNYGVPFAPYTHYKMNKYCLSFFILSALLTYPDLTHAQLSDDSLKAICIRKYEEHFMSNKNSFLRKESDAGYQIRKTTRELFSGCFSNIKLFLIDYAVDAIDDAPNLARLYAIDVNTGLPVNLKNDTAFFNIVNSASKPISNLDKCYLYFILNRSKTSALGITTPDQYKEKLRTNSVFMKDALVLFSNCGTCGYSPGLNNIQIRDDINNSDRWSMYMYVMEKLENKDVIYRYHFRFGKGNSLIGVLPELIKNK